jgi:hypothetical protein
MPRIEDSVSLKPLSFAMLLAATLLVSIVSMPLRAQAPAAGTTIAVKMIDTVNSGSDPAGKQYRASVTKPVDAGNGVTIAQGTTAMVTLTGSGAGYAAQLSSLTINGQQVAVSSNSATVSAAGQYAQDKAASAVNSVLGGFGHHVSAPAAVAANATGQHVSLPTGTTLTFVLGASPAAPAAQPASVQQTASAKPAPSPASSTAATSSASASGGITTLVVCYTDINALYLSAAFEAPADRYSDATLAFSNYLKATYQYSMGVKCVPMFTTAGVGDAQKQLAGFAAQLKPIDTGWRLGQPPVTQGQSGFNPIAQGPGGIDLSQHRLATYMCTLDIAGGTTIVPPQPYNYQIATRYLSPVFQADWDPNPVSTAYKVYIRDHYVHDLNPTADLSPRCSAQSPAMQAMAHQSAQIGTKLFQHVVAVDFTDTPAEAVGGNAAMAQAATAAQAAAAQTAAATFFISCSTLQDGGVDTYYTGVFEIGAKPGRSPHPPNAPGAYIGGTWMVPAVLPQTVLDDFQAYLTQKGYKFKPGSSSACDVKPTAAETQAAQHKRAYEGGGCSSCGNIVETGWKE